MRSGPLRSMTSLDRERRYWKHVRRGLVPGVGLCEPPIRVSTRVVFVADPSWWKEGA